MAGGSSIVKHLYDGKITAREGSSPVVELEIPFTVGDLSLSGLKKTQRNTIAYETRGELRSVRHTTRTYPTGSFSFMVADYSHATLQVPLDFFRAKGSYEGNRSTLLGSSEVYTLDLQLDVEGTDLSDDADHQILLEDCECSFDLAEGEPNKATINFTVYGDVTLT